MARPPLGLTALMRQTVFTNQSILFGFLRVIVMGGICYQVSQEAGIITALAIGLMGVYTEIHRLEHMLSNWYRLLTGMRG